MDLLVIVLTGATLSKPLQLLHIIPSVSPEFGGPVEGILQQCDALGDDGYREIVSLDPPDIAGLERIRPKVHLLGTQSGAGYARSRLRRFGYSPKLVPFLRANVHRFDCVVVNGLWTYAQVAAEKVLPRAGTPYFVFPHGMMDPWFRKQNPVKHLFKQLFWLSCQGSLLSNSRAVLFTTEEERLLARGEFWGYPPYREALVGYGTGDVEGDPVQQIEAFRAAVPNLGAKPYLLFLSRIHPKKGCDLLIRAYADIASKYPDLELVLAGPDQSGWSAQLQKLADKLGVSAKIHWPGVLTGEPKWGAFRGATAFVLPSHQENFGVVVAEALACSTPVLITDKVNIWREIQSAAAGLIGSDDQRGITDMLACFLATDAQTRAHMKAAARSCFETHFDVVVSARNTQSVIKSLL
jgi:glycosyltransferase involved in cell wall biosynthesis